MRLCVFASWWNDLFQLNLIFKKNIRAASIPTKTLGVYLEEGKMNSHIDLFTGPGCQKNSMLILFATIQQLRSGTNLVKILSYSKLFLLNTLTFFREPFLVDRAIICSI